MECSPADSSSVQIGLSHVWAHQCIKGLSPAYNLSTRQWSKIYEFWDLLLLPFFLFFLPVKTSSRLSVSHDLIEDKYRIGLSMSVPFYLFLFLVDFDVWVLIINAFFLSKDGLSSGRLHLVLFLINFFLPSLNLLWLVQWDFLGLFPAVIRHILKFN